jgi:hypothetical protein
MKYFFLLSFFVFCVCSCQSNSNGQTKTNKAVVADTSKYVWTKLLDSAAWKKSYNFQLFTHKDTLWVFHHDGTWYSENGTTWKKSQLTNTIFNHAFLDYVQFQESILGLGHFEGNIEQYNFKPEIYQTTDYKNWITVSKQSNLPERFFYHPFVFNNKIWIIGGEDKNSRYSDIWNSPDGIYWTKQKENLPFGKRSNSQVVLVNNQLYLLNNDVWVSADGLNWELVTNEIVKGEEIFGYAAQAFDNKIWLLGCNRNGLFSSQVLYSENGKEWKALNAPWLPRGGTAATVFKNKIYITGGKYGGTSNHPEFRYDNDLWTLEKK